MTLERVNRCQFCGKTFVRKSWFARHTCAKKRKFEETNDAVVQHAYRVYTYWMRAQGLLKKNKEPNLDKFLKSPYKKSMVDLILFCRSNGIASPYSYIDWLLSKRIMAKYWLDESRIEEYLVYTNKHEDPEEQAIWSLNHIERWVLENPEERTVEQFFERLTAGTILSLVRQKKIKPWVLFTYEPIASKWLDDEHYNPEVFYKIDDIINCGYWSDKIDETPDAVETVGEVMEQLWTYQT